MLCQDWRPGFNGGRLRAAGDESRGRPILRSVKDLPRCLRRSRGSGILAPGSHASGATTKKAAAIPVKGVAGRGDATLGWMVISAVLVGLWRGGIAVVLATRLVTASGVAIWNRRGCLADRRALVVKLPSKASAVDRLVAQFKPILTSPGPQTTARYVSTMSAMSAQLSGQALPALAHELHMTTPGLEQMLAATYPAVGRGFTQLPAILPRFQAMSQLIKANVGNYHAAEALPWKGAPAIMLYWFLAIPGALAAIGGGALITFSPPQSACAWARLGAGGVTRDVTSITMACHGRAEPTDQGRRASDERRPDGPARALPKPGRDVAGGTSRAEQDGRYPRLPGCQPRDQRSSPGNTASQALARAACWSPVSRFKKWVRTPLT